MGLNLEPYNYWILYASLVLLLLFLIVTVFKVLKLAKELKTIKPTVDHIDLNGKLSKIKIDALQEKKKEDAEKNKIYQILLPILLAIKHAYDTDNNLNGTNGMIKAAQRVIKNRNDQKKLFKQFMH